MENDKQLQEIISELQKFETGIVLLEDSYEGLRSSLAAVINRLIINDFSRLISLLYRLDISEQKLKNLLSLSVDNTAGNIIADMIIERQLQKIESRKKFTSNSSFSDEERW